MRVIHKKTSKVLKKQEKTYLVRLPETFLLFLLGPVEVFTLRFVAKPNLPKAPYFWFYIIQIRKKSSATSAFYKRKEKGEKLQEIWMSVVSGLQKINSAMK